MHISFLLLVPRTRNNSRAAKDQQPLPVHAEKPPPRSHAWNDLPYGRHKCAANLRGLIILPRQIGRTRVLKIVFLQPGRKNRKNARGRWYQTGLLPLALEDAEIPW